MPLFYKGGFLDQTKIKILDQVEANIYQVGQAVQLVIKTETDLGYKAIIDGKYWGILYFNEVFQYLFKNQEITGYIRKIRDDGRIDLTLYKLGSHGSLDIGELILKKIEESAGFLNITEKTDAQYIYDLFGVSKKKFKMALGGLYKKRLIVIKADGIYLQPSVQQK
jgi:predicted RNA-binding protein (virulence factor B family)